MIKKGCLFGALLFTSLFVCAADPPRKAEAPKTKTFDWQALFKDAARTKSFKAASCLAGSGGSCKIELTMGEKCDTNSKPDPLILQVEKNVVIFWEIRGGNWKFDRTNGVKFDKTTAPFDNRGNPQADVFHWHVKANAAPGFYSYKIKLISIDGKQTCLVDPAIWI